MTRAGRSLALGRAGERSWEQLEAALRLSPERGRALLVADSADVRGELRRRFESLGELVHLAPGRGLVEDLCSLVEAQPGVIAWIEAPPADELASSWGPALRELNRARDRIGDVFMVLAGDRRMHQLLVRQAPDLNHVLDPVVFVTGKLELIEPLCWMHLSDLHLATDNWQQDEVLDGLLRDLPGLLERAERGPQLLFVTGDVASSGRAEEYGGAGDFFRELLRVLKLGPEQVFLVPGNHDVDRGAIGPSARHTHERLLQLDVGSFRSEVGELVGAPDELRGYGRRLDSWCAFTKTLLGEGREVEVTRPWRAEVVRVSGIEVGVASICSAWMSGADQEDGRLVVGRRQLVELTKALEKSGAELKVALLHHPMRSLAQQEALEIEASLARDFDLVLHGHQHQRDARLIDRGAGAVTWMGAGAAYAGLDQDRWHGFFVGRWDVEAGELDVDAFTWTTNDGGRWHTDTGFEEAGASARRSWTGVRPKALADRVVKSAASSVDVLAAQLRAAARDDDRALGFIGFPPDIESKPQIELSRVFVAPTFTRRRRVQADEALEFEALVASCLGEVGGQQEEALRAVIVGDPGSGKSTLCRVLALRAARREPGPVPLLLRLRELDDDDDKRSLLEMVERQLSRRSSKPVDADALALLCERGPALLLVDGLDELGDLRREHLRERLHGFARNYAKTAIVVTSREAGYDGERLNERFEELHLEPFDDRRLRDFIERWYEVAIPDDPDERSRARARLNAALDAHPQARALARNPLLATLVALVHREVQELPARRVELYRLCVELLVKDWPKAWGRAMPELSGDWQIERLGVLALWMQKARSSEPESEGSVLVARSILDETLEKILTSHPEPRVVQQRSRLAARWRRWLVDSRVLQEQRPGLYGFVHLSLMEYLAGRRLLNRLGGDAEKIADLVVEHRLKASWREILLLMLSSRWNDRAVCVEVLQRVVDASAHERDATFLLASLREELGIGDQLRRDLLARAATIVATQTIRPRHSGHAEIVSDIVQFSRRHGAAVKQWLLDSAREARGRAFVGALLLAPPTLALERQLDERRVSTQEMVMLLALGEEEPWGAWGIRASTPEDVLAWSAMTSPRFMIGHSLRAGVLRDVAAGAWVAGLLRRSAWLSAESSTASGCQAFAWESAGTEITVVSGPAFVTTPGHMSDSAIRRKSLDVEARLDPVSEGDAALAVISNLPRGHTLSKQPFRRFHRCFEGRHVFTNYGSLFQGRRSEASTLPFINDALTRFDRPDWVRVLDGGEDAPPTSLTPTARPPRRPPDIRSGLPWMTADDTDEHWALTVAFFASFHAGVLASSDDFLGRVIGQMRVQNLGLNLFFDFLVDYVARETDATPATLTPGRHALLLALGLVQFQTTWRWPFGERWHEWFADRPPPEPWLPAYVWHLCWAVGDPDDPTHLERARACLARSDWPELVAALREHTISAASPDQQNQT